MLGEEALNIKGKERGRGGSRDSLSEQIYTKIAVAFQVVIGKIAVLELG